MASSTFNVHVNEHSYPRMLFPLGAGDLAKSTGTRTACRSYWFYFKVVALHRQMQLYNSEQLDDAVHL